MVRTKDKENQVTSNSTDYVNDRNRLYALFDCHHFGFELEGIRNRLANTPTQRNGEITVSDKQILKVLIKTAPNKAVGPDGLRPNVRKSRADQLYSILCYIFNLSLSHCTVPNDLENVLYCPGAKKQPVKVMNGLRPTVLTSSIMKAFERVVLVHLQEQVPVFMHSLQFAYRKNRSVEDVILPLLPLGKTWHVHPPNVL